MYNIICIKQNLHKSLLNPANALYRQNRISDALQLSNFSLRFTCHISYSQSYETVNNRFFLIHSFWFLSNPNKPIFVDNIGLSYVLPRHKHYYNRCMDYRGTYNPCPCILNDKAY